MSDSEYDELMQRAKQYANNGQLKKSLKALLAAKEINDNDKVRRRIVKIQVYFLSNLIEPYSYLGSARRRRFVGGRR